MNATAILEDARDVLTVRRVVGEPIERDGTVVIPVVRVHGGLGGGGEPDDATGTGTREGAFGGGLLMGAKPIGVYVIREGKVSWLPAVDVNRLALGGQLVAIAAIVAFGLPQARPHEAEAPHVAPR